MEDLITTTEAAKISRYNRDHIMLLCRTGKLPGARKMGRDWLIPRESLLAYKPGPKGFAAHPKQSAY